MRERETKETGAETLYTGIALAVYVLAFLWLARFDVTFLFDYRMLLAVAASTLLLSAANYRRGIPWRLLRPRVAYNAMIAGYLSAFLFFFATLSKSAVFDPYALAMSLRPIFYGFLLNVLLKARPVKENPPAALSAADEASIREALKQAGVSPRVCDVGVLLCLGLSNAEIAQRLFIGESTVKKHATACYAKLGVDCREQCKRKIFEYLGR